MMKYLKRGEFPLALMLAYYFTWFFALSHSTFSLHVLGRFAFCYICCVVVFFLFLMLMTRIAGMPLFGATKLYFYPAKTAFICSLVLSLIVGTLYAFTGEVNWETQRVVTLIAGFLGSIGAIMLYIRSLVKKQ